MKTTVEGIFDVGFYDSPIPYFGAGSFDVVNNSVHDFEFSMLGFSWDEADAVFYAAPDFFKFEFADAQGGGHLAWDFHQGIFAFAFKAGEYYLTGTSESVDATGAFSYLDGPTTVNEASLLLMFTLLTTAIIGRRSRP